MTYSARTSYDYFIFTLMLLLVPIAGEPQIHPFSDDFIAFRVSFGSPVFLLFLLWLDKFPRLLSGFATGITVMLFRTGLDCWAGLPVAEALYLHLPNFFYYFSYALFFALPKLHRRTIYEQAIEIAIWSIIAEVFASVAELSAMSAISITPYHSLTLTMLGKLLFIAILRCFFILSFFFLFQLYNTEARLARKAKEKDRLSLLISGLYEEVFELRCTLKNAEAVTKDCYNVYQQLKANAHDAKDNALAEEILRIAGECHDIKKNHQRIYAGLSELTSNRHVDDYLPPDKIGRLLINTQQKYARSLNKDITFSMHVPPKLPPLHVFLLLSILNNLAANAVEAIKEQGTITLSIDGGRSDGRLRINLHNTGSFIAPRRLKQVFSPGYTTKFDSSGKASSGVGLTYVKHQTEGLGGTITITSDGKNSVTCQIILPCKKLHRPAEKSTPVAAIEKGLLS